MIKDRIKKLRESVGWSQSELGRQSGVTSAAISKIEGGKCEPSLTVLKKIANALNVTLSALSSDIINARESDEKLFWRKFSIINKLNKSDQELIIELAKRLKKVVK